MTRRREISIAEIGFGKTRINAIVTVGLRYSEIDRRANVKRILFRTRNAHVYVKTYIGTRDAYRIERAITVLVVVVTSPLIVRLVWPTRRHDGNNVARACVCI